MWFKEIIFWIHFYFFSNVAWCNQLDSIMQWWRPYGLNVWVETKRFCCYFVHFIWFSDVVLFNIQIHWLHLLFIFQCTQLYSIITWCFSYWPSYRSEACCIGLRHSQRPIHQTEDLQLGQYEKHHVMIPLLINQSNISRDFSLRLSKRLEDSDLDVIGLTGIGPIRINIKANK
jgi:hypothetical protein